MKQSLSPLHDSQIHTGCLIIGGGPAGLAPLVAASRDATLAALLAHGVIVAEQSESIGAGRVGEYAITSDSTAATLVSCVYENPGPWLTALREHPAAQAVAAYGQAGVPLPLVGVFMAALGARLHALLDATPGCGVLTGHRAVQLQQIPGGLWAVQLRRIADGATRIVHARHVVLALGGHQPDAVLQAYDVAGTRLLPEFGDKLMPSGVALTAPGLTHIASRLKTTKRVVIVGSSSSSIATANALLQRTPPEVQVTVLHRRKLRVFYPSAEAALADGYTDFGPDDLCPVSGFVYRFAGFRLESRALVQRALGVGGRRPPPRLHLHQLARPADAAARRHLETADVIISALGYRPRTLPVLSAIGAPVALQAEGPGTPPLVDAQCRVLDAAGQALPGLFGIGLACGFRSPELSGGEPSFSGQTNGIWQWQNEVGGHIARQLAMAMAAA
ncbi:FAD/NAD(P)-binding protein [Acidocella sp.]|uniref:FAD/NAD(P)-binding protein n=1 Tax=Acidocella sp. TaxID=50710 RepID=UPI00260B565C|nr:FAD/NAD(P)-binding protein [Acidocella sp.]